MKHKTINNFININAAPPPRAPGLIQPSPPLLIAILTQTIPLHLDACLAIQHQPIIKPQRIKTHRNIQHPRPKDK